MDKIKGCKTCEVNRVVGCICNYCKKENCDCNMIIVIFPYGHRLDSMGRNIDFCNDTCLINYLKEN